jgi:hypothetical protein
MILIFLIVTTLIVIIATFYLIKRMNIFYDRMIKYNLIYEISVSLKENCSLYIISEDNFYLNLYKDVLDARAGEIRWTDIQDQVVSYVHGKESITKILENTNYTTQQREILIEIQRLSKILSWIEISAINISQGHADTDGSAKKLFDSIENNTFIVFKDNIIEIDEITNKQTALNLLTENKYLETQTELMNNIYKLEILVGGEITSNMNTYKYLYCGLLLVLLVIVIIAFKKISKIKDYNISMLYVYNLMLVTFGIITFITGLSVYSSGFLRLRTHILSGMIGDISSSLTKNVRDFAKTSDKKYFNDYWKSMEIFNGNIPYSELNEPLKNWRLSGSAFSSNKDPIKNLTVPLLDLLKMNGFLNEEILEYKQAIDENNTLVWKDIESFNWHNKRWDKDNYAKKNFNQTRYKIFYEFSETYKEDNTENLDEGKEINQLGSSNKPKDPLQTSIDILYDNSYNLSTNIIKRYAEKGELLANKRATDSAERSRVLFFISSILLIFISVLLRYQTNSNILQQ